ncbi:hypothetical protein [Providencia manganoxydans]|uniref:hypothetical protein n=1 Tax=Providencia manganoxydans TaxID=2923283 RepID=UPI0032D9C7B7
MEEQVEITTNLCHENICNNVVLKFSKSEAIKIQNSIISNNPSLGNFNTNILGAGLGLVLIFYLLGYGLGRMIKMVNS